MKTLLFNLVTLLALSCTNAQRGTSGSGTVISETRTTQAFTKVKADGVFNVILQQGTSNSVVVETDDNLQALITVTITNGNLTLGMKSNSNFRNSKKMNVYVTFTTIESIENNMVGKLTSKGNITCDKLYFNNKAVGNTQLALSVKQMIITNSSVGKTTLTGTADYCIIENKAVGNLEAEEFRVNKMKLTNKAVGNTKVNATSLDLTDDAVGKTTNVAST